MDTDGWPDPATNLVYILHRFRVPADPLMHWQFLEWKEHEAYVAFGAAQWANVFATMGKDRYERFGVNLLKRRWSYGAQPPDANLLGYYLTHHAKEAGGVLG